MARASRIALDMALEASKTLKPALGTAWQYAKTEIVPPMTLNFFHGPKGKNLEDTISKATDNFISGIQNKINEIEAEKVREIKRKEAAAKALIEKVRAEAKRKAEEAQKKAAVTVKKAIEGAQKKAQATTETLSDVKKTVKEGKKVVNKASETIKKAKEGAQKKAQAATAALSDVKKTVKDGKEIVKTAVTSVKIKPAKREPENKKDSPKTTKNR